MKKPTIAIIGAGAFANVHAQTLKQHQAVELIGAYDVDQKKAGTFTQKWNGTMFATLEDLLSQNVNIITLTTPNETHAEYITTIINHEAAPDVLIVEKPLCLSRNELTTIQAECINKKTLVVVDHSRRFNAGFIKIRDIVSAGKLGKLRMVKGRYYAGWYHIGSHMVDTLHMILGDLTVYDAINMGVDRFPDDPMLTVSLQASNHNNAPITLKAIAETDYKVFECDLVFSKGRIRIQWYDIFIDQAEEDDANAPVLVFKEHFKAESIFEALSTLYTQAAQYIVDNNETIKETSGLEIASGTMETLFTASEADT